MQLAAQVGHFDGYKCVGLAARSIKDKNTHELIGLGDVAPRRRLEIQPYLLTGSMNVWTKVFSDPDP